MSPKPDALQIFLRCGTRFRPANAFHQPFFIVSKNVLESRFSMLSGRRKRCTCSSPIGRGPLSPGSSGKTIEGVEARIVDENNQPVAPGEMGDLIIKTDAACAGYWNQHDRSKDTPAGHLAADGRSVLSGCGRILLTRRALRRHAESQRHMGEPGRDREPNLLEHPDVQEAAVVGRKDEDGLVKTVACVVLRDGKAGTTEAAQRLQRFCSGTPSSFQTAAPD